MMGQHTFKWPYPANEVYVTGTFDHWKRTVRLQRDNKSGVFFATVDLGEAEKTLYKFIVDGNWTVLNFAKTEFDRSGFENNVLLKHEMSTSPLSASVDDAPKPQIESEVPAIADASDAVIQSVVPESTTAALAANVPLVKDEGQAAQTSPAPAEIPTPALDACPGGFPDTPADVPVSNPVEEQTFSVNPMPASSTPGNPINLQPGEPIPESAKLVDDTVHLDKESYERADASNLGVSDHFLPPVVTPAEERAEKGTGIFDIPPITSNLIPESSLPIIGSNEVKAAEESQVAEVPEIVKESQEKAHVEPEASAIPAAVAAKQEVENEIQQVLPEAPVTAEGGAEKKSLEGVPEIVAQSQAAAHFPPEAAANPEAVELKAQAEEEIVHHSPPLHPTIPIEIHSPSLIDEVLSSPAENVPEVVKESVEEAHASPEAASESAAVALKGVVEQELKQEVPEAKPIETKPKSDAPTEASPEAVKQQPIILAATIRKVEPEGDENRKGRPESPVSPLPTPPVTATTHTFTIPVAGTTFNGDSPVAPAKDNASDSSADSAAAKLTEKNTNGATNGSVAKSTTTSEKRVKRRSLLLQKIKSVFK